MSLHATLGRSVIIPENIVCWHPERIWRAHYEYGTQVVSAR